MGCCFHQSLDSYVLVRWHPDSKPTLTQIVKDFVINIHKIKMSHKLISQKQHTKKGKIKISNVLLQNIYMTYNFLLR